MDTPSLASRPPGAPVITAPSAPAASLGQPGLAHGQRSLTGTITVPVVETRQVYKRFGEARVLNGLDFDLAHGEFVAIVGRSGCGKSTLLRLLGGLDSPSFGEIRTDGTLLRGINQRARVMFQDARLMPWKRVLENVGLGLTGNWRPSALEALSSVGLEERARDWIDILSGGQKQRVALARALVHAPELLLLDEPLGALDALTRLEMQALIEKLWLNRQFAAVLITHDVDEAVALADRVLLIESGTIVLDVPIDLPRPRNRAHHRFAAIREQILTRVMNPLA